MRRHWLRPFTALLAIWLLLGSAQLMAAETPLQIVQHTTDKILQLTLAEKKAAREDHQPFYDQVGKELDKVVDFTGFARGVMATYASARQYNALQTEQEKQAFRQRVERFGEKLKQALIVTYAQSLLAFNGEKISVEVPPGGEPNDHRATVNQNIYSSSGKVYLVQYSLREAKPGVWKVRNVVVDGANMGQIYRNQFATAVEKAQGDIDKAIDDWGKQDG